MGKRLSVCEKGSRLLKHSSGPRRWLSGIPRRSVVPRNVHSAGGDPLASRSHPRRPRRRGPCSALRERGEKRAASNGGGTLARQATRATAQGGAGSIGEAYGCDPEAGCRRPAMKARRPASPPLADPPAGPLGQRCGAPSPGKPRPVRVCAKNAHLRRCAPRLRSPGYDLRRTPRIWSIFRVKRESRRMLEQPAKILSDAAPCRKWTDTP
jgi:hypothetical protein